MGSAALAVAVPYPGKVTESPAKDISKRERERDRETETERQRERQRQRERDRHTERERQRDRQRERDHKHIHRPFMLSSRVCIRIILGNHLECIYSYT